MTSITQDMLRGGSAIAWGVFDRDWYQLTYASAADPILSPTLDGALEFYLKHGQARGHSPNPFFDEPWYLETYPKVAEQVRAGEFASGFDHYCQLGYRTNDPHWLFDLKYYRHQNADLTLDGLQNGDYRDFYNHYLRSGILEGRIAHALFSPAYYQPPPDAGTDTGGSFGHYLRGLRVGATEPRTSIYFDPQWYRTTYPQVTEAIGKGQWRSALHHYIAHNDPEPFNPLAEFSEAFYLAHYPDVARALAEGRFRRGYQHFIHHGARERRSPSPTINLTYYSDQHASVREAIQSGTVPDAFVHLLSIGRAQGLRTMPPVDAPPEESQAKALFRLNAAALLPGLARQGIDFSHEGKPDLSIIMVVHNHFALTMRALSSVRQNHPGAIELILIDSGSTDETRHIGRYVRGAQILPFNTNIGYLRGCNAALNLVTANSVLYLNNDVELAPFAIAAALQRLASDPTIGAVGGKVIRTHGRLQEAGCIIWQDGSTHGYMRDASPQAPEANFVRDVDFCSALFLLTRTQLLQDLGGFDDAYAPAYFEDADLCVRITASGHRVVYDPAVVIFHLEYGSAASSLDAQANMARSHRIFQEKHAVWLRNKLPAGARNMVWARTTNQPGQKPPSRVLFIEDMPPMCLVGSGYVRSNDLIRVMVDLQRQVTVFPVERRSFELAAMFADIPDPVEVMHDCTIEDLPEFLAARAGYYDVVWIGRTHNLDRTIAMLPALAGPDGTMPRLILDTEAVAALRDAAKVPLMPATGDEPSGPVFDLPSAIARELANASICEQVIAVSESEAEILRSFGLPRVAVLGHVRDIRATPRAWKDRNGMLFVGAIHAMDSPNYDSLCWFVDNVLPLVERELGWETRLHIAGYTAPTVDLSRFSHHGRITLLGAVTDLAPIYNQHRVFVAPTRFAAGIPYKVHDAASHGIPVVATEILRQQLQWQDGVEILSAEATDAANFARQIVALHRSETLWQTIREGAFTRLRLENSRAAYTEAMRRVLAPDAHG